MIKTGIVGNIATMLPCIKQLSANSGVSIVGKASVGMPGVTAATFLPVPELSKTELFNTADALIIDRFSMVNFEMLKSAVRNYKHLLITDIPELSLEECSELHKLVVEAGTVFQIKNPYSDDPGLQWMIKNWSEPAMVSLSEQAAEVLSKHRFLMSLLLLARQLFGETPHQTALNGIRHTEKKFTALQIRLDYPNLSVLNIEFLTQKSSERKYRAVIGGDLFQAVEDNLLINGQQVKYSSEQTSAIDLFIDNIQNPNQHKGLTLNDLRSVLETYGKLESKGKLNIPWYS